MARPQRIAYEGAAHHVTARGNERRAIFQDDADREHFRHALGDSVERFAVRLYLFCLMTNHLHLVVETPQQRRRNSFDLAVASRMLCDHAGLTERHVAQVLGIGTEAPITEHLRKLTRKLQSDRSLHQQVKADLGLPLMQTSAT